MTTPARVHLFFHSTGERFEALLSRATTPDALFEAVRSETQPILADDWTVLVLERCA